MSTESTFLRENCFAHRTPGEPILINLSIGKFDASVVTRTDVFGDSTWGDRPLTHKTIFQLRRLKIFVRCAVV